MGGWVWLVLVLVFCGCVGSPPATVPTTVPSTTLTTIAQYRPTSTVVPVPEPTTTIAATTSLPVRATTTTAPKAVCSTDSDCGGEINESVYCEGNVIKINLGTPECRFPGKPGAKCIIKEQLKTYLDCGSDWCFQGKCYPQNCTDGILGYNEVDTDCGGVCPPCDSIVNRSCSQSGECGRNHMMPGFWCSEGSIVGRQVSYACGSNGTCLSETKTVPYRECSGEYGCFIGESSCRTHKGTCGNCVLDGDETDVDCGGSCWPCAPRVGNSTTDDAHMVLFFPYTRDIFTYKGYDISYVRPLYSGYGNTVFGDEFVNCTYGAVMRVRKPDLSSYDLEVSRYNNNGVGDIVVGFYWADDWSAKVWVAG
jgi:hypothetical protein